MKDNDNKPIDTEKRVYGFYPDDFVLTGALCANLMAFVTTMLIFWWWREKREDPKVYDHKMRDIEQSQRQAFYHSNFATKDESHKQVSKGKHSMNRSLSQSQNIRMSQIMENKKKRCRMFKWLTDVYHKSEKKVHEEAGQDVLFYLTYLKYSMVLYWVIGLCTGLPLFFVYARLSMPDQSLTTLKTFSDKYSIQALI